MVRLTVRLAPALLGALIPLAAAAAPQDPATTAPPVALVPPAVGFEVRLGAQHLSNGFGNWREATLLGTYETGAHVLQGELAALRRFDENGLFLGVADTTTWNDDWFTRLSVGAGDGAFYLPRIRVDGSLNRKLLARRQLIASLGLGYYRAPDGHKDHSLILGGTYYFTSPWIVQGGVRLNHSTPGSVDTRQQWLAASYGRHKDNIVTLRYGWGREGYQSIGASTSLVDFSSREASLAWRHWMAPNWGVQLSGEAYNNPFYRRRGAAISVFWQ